MAELRTQEQQVLSALESLGGTATVDQLIQTCGIQDTAVMRNALTLQEKNFVAIRAKVQNIVKLTSEGEQYAKEGLPERRLISVVAELGGAADLKQAAEKAGLKSEFIQIALGWAIRKKWATYTPQNNTLRYSEQPTAIAEGCDETFLKYLDEKKQESQEDLSSDLQQATEQLKKRKLVTVEAKTSRTLQITEEGKQTLKKTKTITLTSTAVIAPEVITQLTPNLIISGKWREKTLQKYNIEAPVAKVWPGKSIPTCNSSMKSALN